MKEWCKFYNIISFKITFTYKFNKKIVKCKINFSTIENNSKWANCIHNFQYG